MINDELGDPTPTVLVGSQSESLTERRICESLLLGETMTIAISNLYVASNAPTGTTVGVLTATDEAGKIIPCNFILTKKSSGYFAISNDKLIT